MAIFLFSLLLAVAGPYQANAVSPQAPGQESHQSNTPSAAEVSEIRAKAEAGDPAAENELGVMYRMGEGVNPDKEEAVRWYRRAAKHGSAKAMYNLGAAYYNGDGVGVDDVTSCAWFLLAQEAGHPQADDALSRAAAESAARPVQAAEKIGEMYQSGDELPKSAVNALRWYRKAADGGSVVAAVNAAALLAGGANPTQEEYAEARKRCEGAANLQYSQGAYCMAVIYRRGFGVTKDSTETSKWLARAADLGHPKAMLQLGEAYWKGDGVKPDLITAYMWIWNAYRSRVAGAEQDEEHLRKEMRPKDIQKAKEKADNWVVQHRILPLRYPTADGSPATQ